MDVSLSLSPASSLSKINKYILWWGLKKRYDPCPGRKTNMCATGCKTAQCYTAVQLWMWPTDQGRPAPGSLLVHRETANFRNWEWTFRNLYPYLIVTLGLLNLTIWTSILYFVYLLFFILPVVHFSYILQNHQSTNTLGSNAIQWCNRHTIYYPVLAQIRNGLWDLRGAPRRRQPLHCKRLVRDTEKWRASQAEDKHLQKGLDHKSGSYVYSIKFEA